MAVCVVMLINGEGGQQGGQRWVLMYVTIRGVFVLTIPLLLKLQLLLEGKTLLFFLLHGSGPKIVVYGKYSPKTCSSQLSLPDF